MNVQEKCPLCSTPITTVEKDDYNSDRVTNSSEALRNDNKPEGHRKVHFNIESHSSSSESNEGAEESEDAAANSQDIAVASTSFTNQNFDTLLTQVQRDVRLAKLRGINFLKLKLKWFLSFNVSFTGKQVRHSRSKSESLARILE